jgi:murein DD-endopeptidase MepM/ murein hydrolase activator NlpD
MKSGVVIVLLALLVVGVGVGQAQEDGDVTIHVVQRGETLFRIAQSHGVTIMDLARMNSLVNPSDIKVGQRLLVPREPVAMAAVPATHTIRPGETLRSIANFYNVAIEDLIRLNEIANPNAIYVGQVLDLAAQAETVATEETVVVEAPTPVAPTPTVEPTQVVEVAAVPESELAASDDTSAENLFHTVAYGETLFRIAQRYGLTVNELIRANNIADPTRIYAGERLVIPGHEPPEVALDLPELLADLSVAPSALIEGKTAQFKIHTRTPALVTGTFLGRELNIASDEARTTHTILQGIPLFTEAGVYPFSLVAVAMDSGTITDYDLNLQVLAGPYRRESIRLLAGLSSLLDPHVEANELTLIEQVTSGFTERSFTGSMGLPAAATIISPFGTRRSYNGGPFDRFHSGTDFAGAPGTPVLATAPGRVVLADSLNVRGLATVLDHGWGIYTGYWHQSQQYVQVGDTVTTGQVIGTIGATGRVTGAHLHWELWVGGVPVDPMQWVQQAFG